MILRSHIASMYRTNIMRIRFDFSRNFDWYILNKIHSIYYKIVGKISIGFNRFFLSFLYFGKSIIVCLCVCVCVSTHARTQSCPTFCNPMDCSPPGCSIHGILLSRTLGWVAISSSRESYPPRNQIHVYWQADSLQWLASNFLSSNPGY